MTNAEVRAKARRYIALAALASITARGGWATAEQVATRCGRGSGTSRGTGIILSRMVSGGLVEKSRASTGRKRARYRVTPSGLDVFRKRS